MLPSPHPPLLFLSLAHHHAVITVTDHSERKLRDGSQDHCLRHGRSLFSTLRKLFNAQESSLTALLLLVAPAAAALPWQSMQESSCMCSHRNSATMQFSETVKNPPWEGGPHEKTEEEKVQCLLCYSTGVVELPFEGKPGDGSHDLLA